MNKQTKSGSLLSIVTVNLNTKDITIQAIESIEKSYPKEVADGTYEMVVVDNASTDGSQDALKAYAKHSKFKKFHLVFNPVGLGFGRGNNAGLEKVDGEYIVFLNNDTIVNEKVFPYMIKFLKEHPDCGALQFPDPAGLPERVPQLRLEQPHHGGGLPQPEHIRQDQRRSADVQRGRPAAHESQVAVELVITAACRGRLPAISLRPCPRGRHTPARADSPRRRCDWG